MHLYKYIGLTLFLSVIVAPKLSARQPDSLKAPVVHKTFSGNQIIQLQTAEPMPAKSFNLLIQHRFGKTIIDDNIFKDFIGMDLASNIRFGFVIPLHPNAQLGIARTSYQKTYDANFKFIALQQTTDFRIPVSLALYCQASYFTDDFPMVPENYFTDDGTAFVYKNSHRWAYSYQLIASSKINRRLSLSLNPTMVHKNLAKPDQPNDVWILPAGGRIKTGLFSFVSFEYAYIINKPDNINDAWSFGWEYETASHVFQLQIGSSQQLLDINRYTTEKYSDIGKGEFYFGFNITRTFYIKK